MLLMENKEPENVTLRRAVTQRTRYKFKSTLPAKRGVLRPKYRNKINLFIVKERPSLSIVSRTINAEAKFMLEKLGFSKHIWTRILKNETILTVDELVDIARFLKCNLDDLI